MFFLPFALALLTSWSAPDVPAQNATRPERVIAVSALSDSLNRQPNAPLTAFTGSYQLAPNATLVISLNEGKLYAQPEGDPQPSELKPLGGAEFEVVGQSARVVFQQEQAGTVTGLVVHLGNGKTVSAKKI